MDEVDDFARASRPLDDTEGTFEEAVYAEDGGDSPLYEEEMIDPTASHASEEHAPFLDYHTALVEQPVPRASLRDEWPILVALGVGLALTLALLVFGSLFIASPSSPSEDDLHITTRSLVVVGLEGYRYEYLTNARYASARPRLQALIERGALAPVTPVFPARQSPNLWTIMTGLYPTHHGIVDDSMYDASAHAYWNVHNVSQRDSPAWYGGEPFWQTYAQYGGLSGSVAWLGSTVDSMQPNYTAPANAESEWSAEERVTEVLQWLALPEATRPRFVSLTLSEVNAAGRAAGPNSQEVYEAIQQVDHALGQLEDGLAERDIEHVNWLILSDHGMAAMVPDQVIYLDDHIDLHSDAEVISWGAFVSLRALKGRGPQLVYQLQQVPHLQVWTPDTIPSRYHYSHSPRLADVMLLCDEGWTVSSRARVGQNEEVWGAAGYEPSYGSMQAFLLGVGDYFRSGYVEPTPQSFLHLYSLMARLLDVLPASSDGSWLKLCSLLNDKC